MLLHEYGIKSHGMFVLGADSDDVQTVRDTVAFAIKNKIDTVMLNILTPLPGTRLYDEMAAEGRIIDHDWRNYDARIDAITIADLATFASRRLTRKQRTQLVVRP